jgi:hypothetical protein
MAQLPYRTRLTWFCWRVGSVGELVCGRWYGIRTIGTNGLLLRTLSPFALTNG